MNSGKKIIFDFYHDDAQIYPFFIRYKFKKFVLIPYYYEIKSKNGYHVITKDNKYEIDQFFGHVLGFYVVKDGTDCLTNLKQYIPLFYASNHFYGKNICINLFSSFKFMEKIFCFNVLENFVDIKLSEYNYYNSDIYYDYYNIQVSDKELKKFESHNLKCIQKYCFLGYICNFYFNVAILENKVIDFYEIFQVYLKVIIAISSKDPPLFYKQGWNFFSQETDIIRLTMYKYAPRLCKGRNDYDRIFSILNYEDIEANLQKMHH